MLFAHVFATNNILICGTKPSSTRMRTICRICKAHRTEPAHMVRPCSTNGRRKIAQNSSDVDTKTKENTRKTEEKPDGRNEEGHARKEPK